MEQLTPIDEEPAEDIDDTEDQPITMIPKIMHTAPVNERRRKTTK